MGFKLFSQNARVCPEIVPSEKDSALQKLVQIPMNVRERCLGRFSAKWFTIIIHHCSNGNIFE